MPRLTVKFLVDTQLVDRTKDPHELIEVKAGDHYEMQAADAGIFLGGHLGEEVGEPIPDDPVNLEPFAPKEVEPPKEEEKPPEGGPSPSPQHRHRSVRKSED